MDLQVQLAMKMISNHNTSTLEVIFGLHVEDGYHYEVLCAKDWF